MGMFKSFMLSESSKANDAYYEKLGAVRFVSGGIKAVGKKGNQYVFISTNGLANTFTDKVKFLDRLKSAIDPEDIPKAQKLVDSMDQMKKSLNEEKRYTVYADKQGGGYYAWYMNGDGDKVAKQVSDKKDVLKFARTHLDGMNYKIVWVGSGVSNLPFSKENI